MKRRRRGGEKRIKSRKGGIGSIKLFYVSKDNQRA